MYEEYYKKIEKEGLLRNRKEGTMETYKANIKKFLEWAEKDPEKLTLDDCRNYIYELRVDKKYKVNNSHLPSSS